MRGHEGKQRAVPFFMSKETENMNVKSNRLRRTGLLATLVASATLFAAAIGASPAQAFNVNDFDFTFTNQDGSIATQAGSHPFALTTSFKLDLTEIAPFSFDTDGDLKDLIAEQVAGLGGDTTAIPRCSTSEFLTQPEDPFSAGFTSCVDETAVGLSAPELVEPEVWGQSAVFNLEPPPGVVVRLGFKVIFEPVIIDVGVKQGGEYNIEALLGNSPQVATIFGGALQLWGNPADPALDHFRGKCGESIVPIFFGPIEFVPNPIIGGSCPAKTDEKPLLTLPTSCDGPAELAWRANSWAQPDNWIEGSVLTHDNGGNPQGFTGCGRLAFSPKVETKPTTDSAETGSGLDFNLAFDDEGLVSKDGLAQSHTKKAVVTLPEGVTINPSIGEGLGVCAPAQLDRETLHSKPGEGCPNSSKIGSVNVEAAAIDEPVKGSVFLAQQDDPDTSTPGAENPFDTLIAFYLVLRNPNLGVMVKLPAKVEPDPRTGRLVTTLDNAPQFAFSHFNLHFKEGQRAALVSPPACGTYATEAKLYPWSDPDNPRTVISEFEISEGVNGGPCPPGGLPPFRPHFEAGSINNNAGSFSPFTMRLIRNDGEQNMTKFSSILPPGQIGSLAGVDKCSDVAVAVATSKTGREELASPSCPPNSQIGRTLAGAGVGGALTYVPGQIYLGGPYKGAPLSVIAITPAVAGPFDAGTVAIRLGLDLNPKTAEVEVDGAASDPIPHILKGIVLKLRDLRVYVDRPNFTLNPTSCDESSAKATLFGSYLDVFNPADDVPVDLSTRYQAANCLNLGFKPRLNLTLKGGTKRGGHPGLKALYRPRKGDANVEGLVVRLPSSAFLDQAHIRTICTRVQFAADNCPKGAQYGYIRAWTPLLDEPLQGPVWLRSSNNKLPDLVFDLHGLVDVEVATRIDSAKGGIRATVESAPDAPLTKVELRMQGGKKGLIINSRNLCARKSRANVKFSGHNGKRFTRNPVMRADGCAGKRKAKRGAHRSAKRARISSAHGAN